MDNIAAFIAFAGMIVTALVSIFGKTVEQPLTKAQADNAEADAAAKLNKGWQDYASVIVDDNNRLRNEIKMMEADFDKKLADSKAACESEIAALRKQIVTMLNKQ